MATKLDDNGNLDDNWNDPLQPQKVQPQGLTDPTADALNGLFGPGGMQNSSGQGITDPPMDEGGAAPAAPAGGAPTGAPAGNTGAAPLDPSDPNFNPNVNNPTTTWSAGPDSHPTTQYPGWHWDSNLFSYVKDPAGSGAGAGGSGGGSPVDFLQSLLAGGTSYQDAIKQYNAKFNPGADRQAAYYNTGGHNVIGLPDGVGGPYGGYFTDEGGWHFVPRMQREGGGGDTGGGGNSNSGGIRDVLASYLQKLFGGLQDKTDANAPLRSNVLNQFNSLLDKYSKPVDENDPIIRANADAYHGIQARKLSDYGEMAANRAHSEGVGTGAFDSALGNATSSAGRDEAAYTGGLMTHELDNRRGALSNVINQGKDYLTTEDQQALADKLGTLTAGLGLNGQDNQDTQFYDQLASGLGGQQNSLDSLIYSLLHRGAA